MMFAKRADFKAIGEKFNIDQVIARVIRNRDIETYEDIDKYLNGTLDMVYEPALMKDMKKGCDIMAGKIHEKKSIRIISDYDVDGVMSNYILLDGLKCAGADVSYEIPDRIADGYGINERIIKQAYEDGIDTIITCDNGIAAISQIELAKSLGMTVIVTDHHEVPYEVDETGSRIYKIAPADAVIDIKREDCEYPFKGLCGAAVAYKFIRCLYNAMGLSWEDENRYIEMIAIATVCDVMELVDENRIYVKNGLRLIEATKNIGLRSLLEANELRGKELSAFHIGFVLGPCINAAGRLESAKTGLELLICDDEDKARTIATKLKTLNDKRKEMTEEGVSFAVRELEANNSDNVLVIYIPDMHESIAGIVAGRIRERYYKPVFVLTDSNEGVKGSGRSVEGYHMYDELNRVKDILDKFGGHELAAGLSLKKENIAELRRRLNENEHLTKEQLTPVVRIDVPMPVSYITIPLVEQLKLLEPFGKGNEKPLFAQAGLGIKRACVFGKESQYIRIYFQDKDGYTIEVVYFNGNMFQDCIKMWFSDEECDKMLKGLPNRISLDVAYYPDINEYGGRRTLQIKPVMYKKSDNYKQAVSQE